MNVRIEFMDGALPARSASHPTDGRAGALLMFEGIVRATENDQPIEGLFYEVYEPMAARETERLAREIGDQHNLQAIDITHSRGMVPVGGVSFRVIIEAAHRAEALAAMADFIDRFKKDVPVWKQRGPRNG